MPITPSYPNLGNEGYVKMTAGSMKERYNEPTDNRRSKRLICAGGTRHIFVLVLLSNRVWNHRS